MTEGQSQGIKRSRVSTCYNMNPTSSKDNYQFKEVSIPILVKQKSWGKCFPVHRFFSQTQLHQVSDVNVKNCMTYHYLSNRD